mgnify:FL=1
MKQTPFDFLNSILYNKKYIFNEDQSSDYVPWIINLGLSYHIDTILASNILNKHHSLSKKDQYLFALNTIRAKKRKFVKWQKKINNNDIDLICDIYNCNKNVATQYLNILTEQQIQLLRQQQEKGGI